MSYQTPDAVLLDMDGTLINSEMYWVKAETELAARFGGIVTPEISLQLVGSSLDRTASILMDLGVRMSEAEIISELSHSVKRQVAVSLPWRPGAAELLTELHTAGIPRALVTMSYSLNAQDFARKASAELGFRVFDVIVAGDDVTRGKPDPEPYRVAAARLGTDAGRCVAIEDSHPGVRSALDAGARTIGVPLFHDLKGFAGLTVWDTLSGKRTDDVRTVFSTGGVA